VHANSKCVLLWRCRVSTKFTRGLYSVLVGYRKSKFRITHQRIVW